MIEFLIASVISNAQAHAIQDPEEVNKVCAYVVGIPYASDDFTDKEWERFKVCKELITENKTHKLL